MYVLLRRELHEYLRESKLTMKIRENGIIMSWALRDS